MTKNAIRLETSTLQESGIIRPMNHPERIAGLLLISLLTACGSIWGTEPTATVKPEAFWTINPSTPMPFPTFTPEIVSPTPTATNPAGLPPVSTQTADPTAPILYYVQSGDTLAAVASHFDVSVEEIGFAMEISGEGLLPPETPLLIPQHLDRDALSPGQQFMPDSEIIYSPSAVDFNTIDYVAAQNGYLNTYKQYLSATGWTSGAEAVQRIAIENSINPRLLLALIEYESGWVLGVPSNLAQSDYPLGYIDFQYRLLYRQMMWAVQELGTGYYGWRSGTLTELTFKDGTVKRIDPSLNAGTVAMQYFFSQRYSYPEWLQTIDPEKGFPLLYNRMFGDPYLRADMVEPLFPSGQNQPLLILPFEVNAVWSFTGGPHAAWGFQQNEALAKKGALAALDFAPAADSTGCVISDAWVLASASGRVVRSGNGVVVLDLDGDGYEQSGWNLLYMHIADNDRVPAEAWLQTGDRIGHPSCVGGDSTGTHVHFARKFSGEWIMADGPLPFTLSGWIAHAGDLPYQGTLTRDGVVITANQNGIYTSLVRRTDE